MPTERRQNKTKKRADLIFNFTAINLHLRYPLLCLEFNLKTSDF